LHGWSAVTLAANRDSIDVLELILERYPELLHCQNKAGFTPFLAAAMGGSARVIDFLMVKDESQTFENEQTLDGKNSLVMAAINGHTEIMKKLIQAGFSIEFINPKSGRTALIEASLNARPEAAKLLVAHSANLAVADNIGWTAIAFAANRNLLDVVEAIAQKQPELLHAKNNASFTPFLAAAMGGAADVIDFFLKKGSGQIKQLEEEVTSGGKNALALAAINDYPEIVAQLIKNGFSIDYKNPKSGRTALIEASLNNKINTVEFLIKTNSDIGLKDNHGYTALHLAAHSNDKATLDKFFQLVPRDRLLPILAVEANNRKTAKNLATKPEIIQYITEWIFAPS